jgi:hypothetical protein
MMKNCTRVDTSVVNKGLWLWRRTITWLVRFEVFTAVTMKNAVFWDVASCRSCVTRRFGLDLLFWILDIIFSLLFKPQIFGNCFCFSLIRWKEEQGSYSAAPFKESQSQPQHSVVSLLLSDESNRTGNSWLFTQAFIEKYQVSETFLLKNARRWTKPKIVSLVISVWLG